MRLLLPTLALGIATAAAAGAPTPKDFAHGLLVQEAPGAPAQQFTVPEAVYQGVTRPDLGDLRVFNGGDVVVPHALCLAPEPQPAAVRQQELPVFPLQRMAVPAGRPRIAAAQGRVIVQTPSGTSVQVLESPNALGATPAAPPPRGVLSPTPGGATRRASRPCAPSSGSSPRASSARASGISSTCRSRPV